MEQNPMNPQNVPQGQWQQQPFPGQYPGQPAQQQWQQGAMPPQGMQLAPQWAASWAARPVGFGEAVATCLKKYFVFSGRASRSEYWFFVLFQFLVGVGIGLVMLVVPPLEVLTVIVELAFFIPNLAAGARRLHDTGKSGWWQLFPLATVPVGILTIPLYGLGLLVLLASGVFMIYLFAVRGQDAPNRFDAAGAPQPQQFAQAQAYPQQYPVYGAAPAQGAPYPGQQQPMPQQWPQGGVPQQGMPPVPQQQPMQPSVQQQ